MKALIIYRVDIADLSNRGVSKKMQGHLYGFLENGYEVDVVYQSAEGLYLNQTKIAKFPKGVISSKLFKAKGFYSAIVKGIDASLYDIILIRFHLIMPVFIMMLDQFRNVNSKVKIVIDLPTFPYEKEWNGLIGKILLIVDETNRKRLKGRVDLLLHYGLDKELFGIPCLQTSNGILPAQMRNIKIEYGNQINLLAVGKWRDWHGLDRLLKGMADYYTGEPKNEVILHVIGDGEELESYKEIVNEHKLEENVLFYGPLSGEELEKLYAMADIGVGTLAIQRKGVFIDSSLKHREYCSRGIPFILGCEDLDFPIELDFVKYFEGEEEIEIELLIQFRKENTNRYLIFEYAKKQLNWESKVAILLGELGL